MDLRLIDDKGKAAATVAGSDSLFGRDYNEALIHQIVTAFQANGRKGTRKQKSRGEINKSHKKPWAQKGTGRARAGQANSPLWRGGGKIFPSSPDENFSHKVNRKMFRAGIASILSQLVREDRLSVVDQIVVDAPKTKLLAGKFKALGLTGSVLLVKGSVPGSRGRDIVVRPTSKTIRPKGPSGKPKAAAQAGAPAAKPAAAPAAKAAAPAKPAPAAKGA